MKYRTFGSLSFPISILGQGTMRLPAEQSDYSKVVEDESISLTRLAIEQGINYFDTGYNYHDGASEKLLGKALADGYRERVCLVTKSPIWSDEYIKVHEDFDKILDEQLERLQTAYLDIYMFHGLDAKSWAKCQALQGLEFMERVKAQGKIKHIGFSFHDQFPVFKEIIDAYPWDMCLIQHNYMNPNYQAGLGGLRYAGNKGIPVMIMAPLYGGRLVENVPGPVMEIWDNAETKRTPASWGLSYLWDMPEVFTILSGMNSLEEMKENIAIADTAKVGMLSHSDKEVIAQARDWYNSKLRVNCTECNYCQPCPMGVAIPKVFNAYNAHAMQFLTREEVEKVYDGLKDAKKDVTLCNDCGKCESSCPQVVEIRKNLRQFHEEFKKEL